MNAVIVISTEIIKKIRKIKIQRFGKSDIQDVVEASPFGTDSNPPKNLVAVYLSSDDKSNKAIVGYINKNQLADVGEWRAYSTDESGLQKFYIWLKNTGEMEIGGNSNYAVKFNELKTEFNALKKSHNDLLTEYKTHIHSGGTISGSTGTTVSTQIPNSSNIDNCKNAKIKTI